MANDVTTTTGRPNLIAIDKALAAIKPDDKKDLERAISDLQYYPKNLPACIERAEALLRRLGPMVVLARKAMEPASDKELMAHLGALVSALPSRSN
jgi:hypothetical protein